VDREQRVLVVVGPGELELELQGAQPRLQPLQERVEIGVGEALGDQLPPGRELLAVGGQTPVGLETALDGAALAQDGRARGGVFPEALRLGLPVELRDALG